ncbi:hypothetical protein HMPREF9120_00817, partial [Neisseria sp. oral taxon 020 str. F0370]
MFNFVGVSLSDGLLNFRLSRSRPAPSPAPKARGRVGEGVAVRRTACLPPHRCRSNHPRPSCKQEKEQVSETSFPRRR